MGRTDHPGQTIVVYMGLLGLETLCSELVAHGMPESTAAAIVQQGTTQNQRVVTGTLATLPSIALREHLHAPTLIIVGGVVTLRDKLSWFKPEQAGHAEKSEIDVKKFEKETS